MLAALALAGVALIGAAPAGAAPAGAVSAGAAPARAVPAGAASAPPASAASVSTNWAGYVASPSARVGSRFGSVSGRWTVPGLTCAAGRETHSAAWVGLGGDSERSSALEQIGTDADCSRAGAAAYTAWYELVPAGPVELPLKLRTGDRMSASVTLLGHDVTLRIRDLSTGARFDATRRVSRVDVSSAEWIVEAPSVCFAADACATLALSDFGTLSFSSATATAAGHTGAIADPDWSAAALELRQSANAPAARLPGRRFGLTSGLVTAVPSPPTGPDGSFSVSWQEQSIQVQPPRSPTMPGFGVRALDYS
jgi:Peptidase A4 family